jgi:outer membrane protein OmpA-like peptidoglycan-associated protein
MMKWITPLFALCVVVPALAQGDTLIYATGKIVNAASKEPVVARISYESLPYGSHVGMLNGSEYRFALFDNEKYAITVEAPGFAKAKYMLDPASAENRVIALNIELSHVEAAPAQITASTEAPRTRSHEHQVGKVIPLPNLNFQQSKAKIQPESFKELDEIVSMLKSNGRMVIQLEGHTDFRGDPKENMKLAEARVAAVRDYLVSKGVGKHKIKTKAFGGTQPLTRENTDAARALNRRVEVRILEN